MRYIILWHDPVITTNYHYSIHAPKHLLFIGKKNGEKLTLQLYGLSEVWTWECFFRSELFANRRSQPSNSHLNGFSPVTKRNRSYIKIHNFSLIETRSLLKYLKKCLNTFICLKHFYVENKMKKMFMVNTFEVCEYVELSNMQLVFNGCARLENKRVSKIQCKIINKVFTKQQWHSSRFL